MAKWTGKSRGTVLGYKIFVFCIRYFGVRTAYTMLIFVAAYFYFFAKEGRSSIAYYFRERLGYGFWKTQWAVYQNYFVFGQTLIDKVAISAGLRDRFTYEFDGIEHLRQMMADQKGGVLISAHIGNFEIAERFFAEIDFNYQINLVTTDLEHSAIKEYLESIQEERSKIKFIFIKEDLSHIFEINKALSQNELICFTGDRYFEGTKYMAEEFLGKEAKFPAGPFMIASRLQVPVAFVYVMKEKNLHYHLSTRITQVKNRDAKGLLTAYVQNLTTMLKRYPLQWFNYFDFWERAENEKI